MTKRQTITAIIALLVTILAWTSVIALTSPKPPVAPPTQATAQVEALSKYEIGPPTAEELLELVNAERAKVGVAPLVIKDTLAQSAQWKADDMMTRNYFAHTDPDTGKNNGLDYFFSIDSACRNASENIRWIPTQSATSQNVFNGWYKSAPHVAAIRNGQYSLTGIAVAQNDKGYYITEHFCITR